MAVNIAVLLILSFALSLESFNYSFVMESAVELPDGFQYGDDFDIFYRLFGNFVKIRILNRHGNINCYYYS